MKPTRTQMVRSFLDQSIRLDDLDGDELAHTKKYLRALKSGTTEQPKRESAIPAPGLDYIDRFPRVRETWVERELRNRNAR